MTAQENWLAALACAATPSIEDCLDVLGSDIDWLYALEQTEQDTEWHAEGNVYIHTGMVLSELYKLLATDAKHIQGWQRQALILAALLHDVGKTVRTRRFEVDGVERIGAPLHAEQGRSYLSFKLLALALPVEVIWCVLNLVGEHHMPKRLIVRNKGAADYFKLARQANIELLYWLEVADIKGRICPDPTAQLQVLDEFRMFAEEYSVWGAPLDIKAEIQTSLEGLPVRTQDYVYAYAQAQLESGKINLASEAIGTTYEHRDDYANLVVLCGPSGSGKTRWHTEQLPGYSLISLDDLRERFNGDPESQKNRGQILQQAKEELRQALREKRDVIWDATNLRTDFRSIVATLGRDYHALVTLVVFLLPEKQLHINNNQRDRSVASSVIEKQLSSYQFPLLSEVHQFLLIDHAGQVQYCSGYLESPHSQLT